MKNLGLLALVVAPLLSGCVVESRSSNSDWSSSGSGSGYAPAPSTGNLGGEHSLEIDTDEMRVSMSAQSDGTTTKIYAAIFDVETSQPIQLDTGDFFTATAGGSGDPIVLVYEPSDDLAIHYAGTLPASTTAQDVVISFVRQNGGASAPSSTIHVPASFAVVAPSAIVNYGDTLAVKATPVPTDDIEIEATGMCLQASYSGVDYNPNSFDDAVTFDQAGNASFQTSLFELGGTSSSAGCDITLYFSAIHDGVIDPNFAGGVSGTHDVEGTFKTTTDITLTQLN